MDSEMYIYSNETDRHVATVKGSWKNDRDASRAAEDAGYSSNDYSGTSTLHGVKGGENKNAEIIDFRE